MDGLQVIIKTNVNNTMHALILYICIYNTVWFGQQYVKKSQVLLSRNNYRIQMSEQKTTSLSISFSCLISSYIPLHIALDFTKSSLYYILSIHKRKYVKNPIS